MRNIQRLTRISRAKVINVNGRTQPLIARQQHNVNRNNNLAPTPILSISSRCGGAGMRSMAMSTSTQAGATHAATSAYYTREQESASSSLNNLSSMAAVAFATIGGAAAVASTSSKSPEGNNSTKTRKISFNHPNHQPQTLMATSAKKIDKKDTVEDNDDDETTTLLNWSGTHEINLEANQYYEPETVEEVQDIVQQCYKTNTPFRPVGSGLSPNAIGFHYTARRNRGNKGKDTPKGKTGAMVNLVLLDKILNIDKENMTVTVQAGARVSQVIDALRPYGLTLPNLASIAEQQVGGFIQVGAHGTGARIAPVDEFCTSLTMVTPYMGTVTLSGPNNSENLQNNGRRRKQPLGNQRLRQHLSETFANAPSLDPLFQISKVGLGSLGIVTEVTMQCIPAHNLVEHTFVVTRQQAKDNLNVLLKKHKHIRYMWIPYEDAVVVVTNDPEASVDRSALSRALQQSKQAKTTPKHVAQDEQQQKMKPLTDLLLEVSKSPPSPEDLEGMGFGELRDQLLAVDPLDVNHVKRCNEAEAEFWRNSEGYQVKPSDKLLQFDCGGQQWVWEICFPTGTYESNNGNDVQFMEKLLAGIEAQGIAAHSPIEQRWSASSSSFMSPAYDPNPEGLHCWVGIIMYLPDAENIPQRTAITNAFNTTYSDLMRKTGQTVNAASHWAKLELPATPQATKELQLHMRDRYPVNYYNHTRYTFDPTNLMSNDLINAAFGDPADSETCGSIANKPRF